jgi:UDP:flavonoid glycosyltransferase YjiC (YdhE family)
MKNSPAQCVVRQRKKILFMAEGITMTHFVRPASLAEALDPSEWDVYFWTPKRYHSLLRRTFSGLGDLRTIEPKKFLHSLDHGEVAYSAESLRAYVHDDQEIFQEIRPDLIIGDYRLSICISAPLSGLPFASIFNAHWSPYYKQPAIVPDHLLTQWVSPRLLGLFFAVLRPAIFSWHAKPVNDVRRSFGMPPLPNDLKGVHTAGDLVLYPDVPEFVPITRGSDHHHFIGICPWSSPVPKPVWWSEVMNSPQPKIFVSLGTSGPMKILPAVLEAVSSLPVEVLLATSGRGVGPIPKNVHMAELLPYEETARHSALIVSHGGTGGLYPTLAAGAPMLAIPVNIDMHQSTYLLERSGAGIGVRVEYASPRRLRDALERLLREPSFREAAQKWATIIARYDTRKMFPEVLRKWFAGRS